MAAVAMLRSARILARVLSSAPGVASTSQKMAATAAPAWSAMALVRPAAGSFASRAFSTPAGVSPLQGGVSPLQGGVASSPLATAKRAERKLRGREAQRQRLSALGEYGEPLFSQHVSRDLAISPKKLNDFAKVVRGLSTRDALLQCQVSVKKSATLVQAGVQAAVKRAVEKNGADADALTIAEAWVGKGTHLKRMFIKAKGVANQRLKYRSHLTIVLKAEKTKDRTVVVPTLTERTAAKLARQATA